MVSAALISKMKIALASDHAGYEQLKDLQEYLISQGHECQYLGPKKLDPQDDYPDFIIPAARAVASGEAEAGILIGGDGEGEAMAANRIRGVRCAVFYGPAVAKTPVDIEGDVSNDPFEVIKLTRQHNNANMLSLGARFLTQKDVQHAVKLWLDTPFSNVDRHVRRISKLDT